MSESPSLEEFLAQQRADYRASLPERLARLQAAWSRVLAADHTPDGLHDLERCAHGLAGSAATFGLAPLGDAARGLEDAVEALSANGAAPAGPALASRVDRLAALLREAIAG